MAFASSLKCYIKLFYINIIIIKICRLCVLTQKENEKLMDMLYRWYAAIYQINFPSS